MKSRFLTVIAVALLIMVAPATTLLAQSQASTGIIEGTVADQSGAVLPGVTVSIRQTESNFERVVISDDSGRFRARLLPVGPYLVTAELAGFKQYQRALVLTIGSILSIQVQMELGEITQIVTISSESSPLVDTQTVRPQVTIDENTIENLPINGRDFQSFVFLTPGTVQAARNTISLGGAKGIDTSFQVDGADRTNPFFGGQSGGDRPPFTFSQEAVREFVVVKDGYSAEFGRSAGGVVNVVTKSGTNEWHGGAFYLYQDNSFISDELSLTANTDGSLTESRNEALGRRHQFGGSIGGPIVQDRAFFFFSTEHQDFTRPLFVRFTFDDAERALIQQNFPELLSFEGSFNSTDNAQVYLGKVDFTLNNENNVSVRYTFTDSEQANGTFTGTTISAVDNNGLELDTTHQIVGSWYSVFSPRLVNEFRFNWVYEDRPRESNVNYDTSEVRIGSDAIVGGVWFLPIPEDDDRYQITENLGYSFGAHDMKFGFEYNDTGVDQIFFGNGRGQYRFRTLDDFIAGRTQEYRQRFGTGATLDGAEVGGQFKARVQEVSFFVQDSWRVNQNVTLNLGLRWEGQYNPGIEFPNTDFPEYGNAIADDDNNWAPRIGLAWDLTGEGRTIFKASAGIFHGRTPMLLYSNPVKVNGDVANDVDIRIVGQVPIAGGGQSFPGYSRIYQNLQDAADDAGIVVPSTGTFPGAGVNLHTTDFQNPESYRYTLAIEHEIAPNWAVGASYTHADTRFRQLRRDINLFPGTPGPDGRLIYGSRAGRPFRPSDVTNSTISLVESTGISEYDAFTLSLNKRFSSSFQFQAHYTLGHNDSLEDNERDATTIHPTDPDNLMADFGRSDYDIRHNFVVNGVWDLPWDFQLSGIMNLNSARPWNAITNNDNNFDGQFNDRPIIDGSVVERNAFENDRFFNFDMRVTKKFSFTETAKASAFIEFFNLFNARNYIVVNNTFGRTGFGVPTRQGGDPFSFQLGFRFDF